MFTYRRIVMNDCIFCKIVNKEIPSEIVYEDDYVISFKDIQPAAPIHLLVIPKKHIEKVTDLSVEDEGLIRKNVYSDKFGG